MRRPLAAIAALAGIVALTGCGGVERYDLGDEPTPSTVAVRITTTTMAEPAEVVADLVPELDPDAVTHEIVPGDALYDLALRYGTTVDAIVEANSLTDPAGIPLGTVIVIPSPPDTDESAEG